MLSKILGSKGSATSQEACSHEELVQKVSKMNLTEMRSYVKNKILDFPISEDGIIEVINRVTIENEESSQRYIKADDMDSKKKKAMDLVISILEHKMLTVKAIERAKNFMDVYAQIIVDYDQENKEIYYSKLKNAVVQSIGRIEARIDMTSKIDFINK